MQEPMSEEPSRGKSRSRFLIQKLYDAWYLAPWPDLLYLLQEASPLHCPFQAGSEVSTPPSRPPRLGRRQACDSSPQSLQGLHPWLLSLPESLHPLPPSTSSPQASLRACGMSSSASGTTSPSPPPLRTATCSSGTYDGPTAVRGCSPPTTGLSSAATGTLRTGVRWGGVGAQAAGWHGRAHGGAASRPVRQRVGSPPTPGEDTEGFVDLL